MLIPKIIILAIFAVLVTAKLLKRNVNESPYSDVLIFLGLWLMLTSIGGLLNALYP